LRNDIVLAARRFIGIDYQWGGSSVEEGFDCSGLTMTVYRLVGLELPRSASQQYQFGKAVDRDALLPGDLVFFATGRGRRISHVGIYSGPDTFIHAPGRGKSIRSESLELDYFRKRYIGARRYY
jgi:cell wall-associated NlpC family hydrolase